MEIQILTPSLGELVPINPIRVETVLSRYPVHSLARNKAGHIKIDLSDKNERGDSFRWKVVSSEYGQPGPLAYKIDTLIINRRIEEARPRVPKLIRLGSLSDLCKELGLADSGKNRADIKNALLQNAFAGIVPLIRYQDTGGTEETLETAFNRYSIILTGKKLPDGRKADAVYIVLNDVFMRVINGAVTRPLDYDYLKSLPPAAQRFYEVLSFRMYATIKHDRPRAKLTYSEFCSYAPQKRYVLWKRVRSQMSSIHRKHQESGYIDDVTYQETVGKDGLPDWIMHYKPGPKARAEFREFNRRGGPVELEVEPFSDDPFALFAEPQPALLPAEEEPPPLVAALVQRGVGKDSAMTLVHQFPPGFIEGKIEQFDWAMSQSKKPKNPAGFLVKSILQNYNADPAFVSKEEKQRQAEARQARERQEAEERRRQQDEAAREQAERKEIEAYWKSLTPEERNRLEAEALAAGGEEANSTYEIMKQFSSGGRGYMKILCDDYIRGILQKQKVEA